MARRAPARRAPRTSQDNPEAPVLDEDLESQEPDQEEAPDVATDPTADPELSDEPVSTEPAPQAPVEPAPVVADTPAPDPVPAKDPEPAVDPDKAARDKRMLSEADLNRSEFRKFYLDRLEASGIVPPKGKLLFPGEPMTFTGRAPKNGEDFVILDEDVYRMSFPMRARRPIFTLEATAGTRLNRVKLIDKDSYKRRTDSLLERAKFDAGI